MFTIFLRVCWLSFRWWFVRLLLSKTANLHKRSKNSLQKSIWSAISLMANFCESERKGTWEFCILRTTVREGKPLDSIWGKESRVTRTREYYEFLQGWIFSLCVHSEIAQQLCRECAGNAEDGTGDLVLLRRSSVRFNCCGLKKDCPKCLPCSSAGNYCLGGEAEEYDIYWCLWAQV